MDKNNFFKKDALRPTEEQRLLTKQFYQNANTIYQHIDVWKGWKKDGTAMLRLRFTFKRQGRYLKTNIIARRKSLGNWLCGNRIVQRI